MVIVSKVSFSQIKKKKLMLYLRICRFRVGRYLNIKHTKVEILGLYWIKGGGEVGTKVDFDLIGPKE